MLDALRFVEGALGNSEAYPHQNYFHIANGLVKASNGVVTMCSKIPIDWGSQPHGSTLLRAVEQCHRTAAKNKTSDTMVISLADNKLNIKSGKFRSSIPCLMEPAPDVYPEGELADLDHSQLIEIIEGLGTLHHFIATDSQRPWATGILFKGNYLYATNNVIVCRCKLSFNLGFEVNVPGKAIEQLLTWDIPHSIRISQHSITFHMDDSRWIKSQLLSTEWPDVDSIIERNKATTEPIGDHIFTLLNQIKPFCHKSGRVHFTPGHIHTEPSYASGTDIESDSITFNGVYILSFLQMLENMVTQINWGNYPAPCYFSDGHDIDGLIVGLKE